MVSSEGLRRQHAAASRLAWASPCPSPPSELPAFISTRRPTRPASALARSSRRKARASATCTKPSPLSYSDRGSLGGSLQRLAAAESSQRGLRGGHRPRTAFSSRGCEGCGTAASFSLPLLELWASVLPAPSFEQCEVCVGVVPSALTDTVSVCFLPRLSLLGNTSTASSHNERNDAVACCASCPSLC